VKVAVDLDGGRVLRAFTSEAALTRSIPEGSPYVAIAGEITLGLLLDGMADRLVVDGTEGHARTITRAEAQRLLAPTTFTPTLLIGLPAEAPPEGLVDALRHACSVEHAIGEAYLYQSHLEHDAHPSLALGLWFQESIVHAEVVRIVESIVDDMDLEAWGYEFLDIQILSGELLDAVRANGIVIR
jgi:hypothetical protein